MASTASTNSMDENTGPRTGRTADSPAQIPARGWKQVALRSWKQSSEDNVGLVAAGVAFYGFLALVPLLGAVVLTYGIIADPQTVMSNVKSLANVMPRHLLDRRLNPDQLFSEFSCVDRIVELEIPIVKRRALLILLPTAIGFAELERSVRCETERLRFLSPKRTFS